MTTKLDPDPNNLPPTRGDDTATLLAVIDIGTTSIRMSIAQRDQAGSLKVLDKLNRPAPLGKDTFTRGSIQRSTIEDCVNILLDYRRVLEEYGFSSTDKIRVIATNAVREAQNRLAFVDRIFIATGFTVEPIDDAEAKRLTYYSVQPFVSRRKKLKKATNLVIEIGGGSTDILSLQDGLVTHSHSYRLGSLRLGETLNLFRLARDKRLPLLTDHIHRTIERIHLDFPFSSGIELIALGGEARFAAAQIAPDWNNDHSVTLPVTKLQKLATKTLTASPNDLVRKYGITFIEAETLGISLNIYAEISKCYELKHIYVSEATLRNGLLTELSLNGAWTEDFRNLVIQSAIDLGQRYQFIEAHARHTAELCHQLFTELRDVHRLPERYELILYIAALLHDIGYIVSDRSHHKHAMFLIRNSELFGLSQLDLLQVALVARYHRKANPKPLHEGYSTLDPENRIAVSQMAAILRTADALDRSGKQRITDIACAQEGRNFIITVKDTKDLSLEKLALKEKGRLFEDVFGMSIVLRNG